MSVLKTIFACCSGKHANAIVVGLCLGFISSAAVAFQDQPQGAPATAPAAKAVELGPDAAAPKAPVGTEVRIPGLGKLGSLPKMDFGLELLYGAADKPHEAPVREDGHDDLTIRGTVKHSF